MPIQAFVDESGGRGQLGQLVLAGVLGQSEDWMDFSDAWQAVLDADPSVKAFHMYDAVKHQKEFRAWSASERDARLGRLIEVVNSFQFSAIFCAIDIRAYREIVESALTYRSHWPRSMDEHRRLAKPMNDPYFLGFHAIIMSIATFINEQGSNERFDIIFDDNRILGPRVRRWYPVFREAMSTNEKAVMPIDPLFRDDKDFVPLQLADMLAWTIRNTRDSRNEKFRWVLEQMQLGRTGQSQFFDAERLQSIVDLSRQGITDEFFDQMNKLLGLTREAYS